MISVNELADILRAHESERFGLCMFAHAMIVGAANRKLNAAYNDSGDNLSVPLSDTSGGNIIKYFGGN